MDQLILGLSTPPPPTLDNFVVGGNAELIQTLRAAVSGQSRDRLIYIWGEQGSGRSHLLRAVVEAAEANGAAMYFPGGAGQDLANASRVSLWAVDDVNTMVATAAIRLFAIAREVLSGEGYLIAAGDAPPAGLLLREDLRTRLGAGLVFRVLPLSDEEKLAALSARACHLGFNLPSDAGRYLLRHCPRDLPNLLSTLDALDQLSVKLKRSISVALLREYLHGQADR
jgi:DnaA-homolog protein